MHGNARDTHAQMRATHMATRTWQRMATWHQMAMWQYGLRPGVASGMGFACQSVCMYLQVSVGPPLGMGCPMCLWGGRAQNLSHLLGLAGAWWGLLELAGACWGLAGAHGFARAPGHAGARCGFPPSNCAGQRWLIGANTEVPSKPWHGRRPRLSSNLLAEA